MPCFRRRSFSSRSSAFITPFRRCSGATYAMCTWPMSGGCTSATRPPTGAPSSSATSTILPSYQPSRRATRRPGPGPSSRRPGGGRATRPRPASPSRIVIRRHAQPGEQVVRGQVLERLESRAHRAHLRGRERGAVSVERLDRLAQAEVAGRPGARPREVAREEPVDRPLADAADRLQLALDLLVGQRRDARQSSPARAIPSTYSALRREKPVATISSAVAAASAASGREGVGVHGADAEALDQPVADRERGEERDLLRRDRGHERLERVGPERRPEAADRDREPLEDGVGPGSTHA